MARTPPRKSPRPPAAPAARPFPRGAAAGLIILVAGIALAAWWWFRAPAFAISPTADRNVLLVTIDTLRADALGTYGGRAITPNLDALAAHGARFDFAHAHAVVTLVSHSTILSGRYPYEHGVRDNSGYRFPAGAPTMATRLKAKGFATGAFVGGFPLDHRFGLSGGFDVYDDSLGAAGNAPDAAPDPSSEKRRANLVVQSALTWIGGQTGPWFAWVHVYDPHAPYAPPAEWAAKFPSDPYLGEVSWTDSALGPLFDRARQSTRPTLVVVTGDHGESLGEHGELTHSIFAYESTLHVPLIVAEVGASRPDSTGVVIATPVRHVDLLPTILQATGVAADDTLPGTSLRDVIAAGSGADRPAYFEAMTTAVTRGWAPLRGVLSGHDKFIDLPIAELYDLAGDPRETRNDINSRADRAKVLINTLKGFNVAPPGAPAQESAENLERLRALGYIGSNAGALKQVFTEADDPKRLIELEQTMLKALDAFRENRMPDAIALYRSVIAKRPDTEDAYRRLALVYWRMGQPKDAVATLEAALKAGITQSEVRIKLGQYLVESGQPAQAVALLDKTAGDDPDALIALGNAYAALNRTAEALATYQHLTRVDPRSSLGWRNIGVMLYQSGRRADAIDAWKRAVEVDATEFETLFNLTRVLAEAGRNAEAIQYGQRFVATAPPAMAQDVQAIRELLAKIK